MISVKEYLFKSKQQNPIIDVINSITEKTVTIQFDQEVEDIISSLPYLKNLLSSVPYYSIQTTQFETIDVILELISTNPNIQKLIVSASFLSGLIISKLYSSVIPLVQVLEVQDSISSLVNDIKLEPFKLKFLQLEKYDPQTYQEFSCIDQLIQFSEKFTLGSFTFKAIQSLCLLEKSPFDKLPQEINLRLLNSKALLDNKIVKNMINTLSEIDSLRLINFDYYYCQKTSASHQFLSNLKQDIKFSLESDENNDLKQLVSSFHNKPNLVELTLDIPNLKQVNTKGVKLFNQTTPKLNSLVLKTKNENLCEFFLQQVMNIKSQLKKFSIHFSSSSSFKLLIPFLQNNEALTHFELSFQHNPKKLIQFNETIIPIISKLPQLHHITLGFQKIINPTQFKEHIAIQELLQKIATNMPQLNSLTLVDVWHEDILAPNVIEALKDNKSLANIKISLYRYERQNINSLSQYAKIIYTTLQQANLSTKKVELPQFESIFSYNLPYELLNAALNSRILHFATFQKIIAPEMLFLPQLICLDLFID